MIRYPYLQEQPSSRVTTDVFRGLNLGSRIGEGEFCEMLNLTADHYPVLSPRAPRGKVGQTGEPSGMYSVSGTGTFLIDAGRLYFIDERGNVQAEEEEQGSFGQGPHRFALMGKNLIVVPDMKYIDIDHPTKPYDIGEKMVQTSGVVTISLCNKDGINYTTPIASSTPPSENLSANTVWIDTSQYPQCLKQYNSTTKEWVSVASTYLKLYGLDDNYFDVGDGVQISGLGDGTNTHVQALNGSYVIEHYQHGSIVIPGILSSVWSQDCSSHPITIERKVPAMDFIVESGNRLWGCSSAKNEIYGCKLGDFRNWNVFSGISTDSWAANVGSPGKFTGAINHGGYPVFYKRDMKHKIWPSSTGAHQITSTPCMGVQQGSGASLATKGNSVLYLADDGVYMDDGSGAVKISTPLEFCHFRDGVGAVCGDRYYLSAKDGNQRSLYVYNLRRGLWHRENQIDILCMAPNGEGSLLAAEQGKGQLWDLTGNSGTKEETVHWSAVTGDLCQSGGDRQYISRVNLRLSLEEGSRLDIYARYDHNPLWVKLGTVYGTGPDSFSLPVRPRRCDHLQLKLEGVGGGKVYAITRSFEKGSAYR